MRAAIRDVARVLVRRRWKTLSYCLFFLLLFLLMTCFWAVYATISQNLEQNLYENLHNRIILVQSANPISEETRSRCGLIPYVNHVIPKAGHLFCQEVDGAEMARPLPVEAYTDEESLRVTQGQVISETESDAVLLPERFEIRQGNRVVEVDNGAWIGKRITFTLTGIDGQSMEYRSVVKGTYSRDQLYYENKGIYVPLSAYLSLIQGRENDGLLLIVDSTAHIADVMKKANGIEGLMTSLYTEDTDDENYPVIGYLATILCCLTEGLSLLIIIMFVKRYLRTSAKGYALYAVFGYSHRIIFLKAVWELSCMAFSSLLLSGPCSFMINHFLLPEALERFFPNICIQPTPISLLPVWSFLALSLLVVITAYTWGMIQYLRKEKPIYFLRT